MAHHIMYKTSIFNATGTLSTTIGYENNYKHVTESSSWWWITVSCQYGECPAQGQGPAPVPRMLLSASQSGCYVFTHYVGWIDVSTTQVSDSWYQQQAMNLSDLFQKPNTLLEVCCVELWCFYVVITAQLSGNYKHLTGKLTQMLNRVRE